MWFSVRQHGNLPGYCVKLETLSTGRVFFLSTGEKSWIKKLYGIHYQLKSL